MSKTLMLCVILSVQSLTLLSQIQIKGRVVNEKDDTPIAYANIGVINSAAGTISNEDGRFFIVIPDSLIGKRLTFFALGFEGVGYSIEAMKEKFNEIKLKEKPIVLRTVTVTPKAQKTIVADLGSRVRTEGTQYYDSSSAGAAMAIKVRSNAQPTYFPDLQPPLYVKQARLWIHQNFLKNFKVRVRLFDIDKNTGLPGKDLINESVIISSSIKKGWVKAELEKFDIAINDIQFFLVFEWIMDDQARLEIIRSFEEYEKLHPEKVRLDTIDIPGKQIEFVRWDGLNAGVWFGSTMSDAVYLNNTECYYRKSSLAQWERSSTIMAAQITVSNSPGKKLPELVEKGSAQK